MGRLLTFANSTHGLWALLALPSVPMAAALATGLGDAEEMLETSGEIAAWLLILAMVITPFRLMFPKAGWPVWLFKRRRYFGVAAFGYALLHVLFYVVDLGSLQLILDEFFALGIWTGWAAFAIFLPLALTSNDFSQKLLRKRWKTLQRGVYAAAVFTLVHWMFVHNEFGDALAMFAPLAALEAFRIWKTRRGKRRPKVQSQLQPET